MLFTKANSLRDKAKGRTSRNTGKPCLLLKTFARGLSRLCNPEGTETCNTTQGAFLVLLKCLLSSSMSLGRPSEEVPQKRQAYLILPLSKGQPTLKGWSHLGRDMDFLFLFFFLLFLFREFSLILESGDIKS